MLVQLLETAHRSRYFFMETHARGHALYTARTVSNSPSITMLSGVLSLTWYRNSSSRSKEQCLSSLDAVTTILRTTRRHRRPAPLLRPCNRHYLVVGWSGATIYRLTI